MQAPRNAALQKRKGTQSHRSPRARNEGSNIRIHGGLWHEPDLPACPLCGRYQGESGRGAVKAKSTRMTHS